MAQFIKNRVVRIILRVLVGILFVPILALILVQFPQIQTKLTNYVIEKVNSNWEYKLSLEKISVSWFDEAEFQNLLLQDPEGNNLLSVDEVKMDFNIYSLLFGENIEQDVIILNQPEFLLTQILLEDSTYSLNINHFLRTLQKGEQKGKAKDIYINQIYVKGGSFTYRNQIAEPIPSGFDPNYFNFEKTSFQLDFVSIIGPDVKMHISELSTTEPNIGLEISPLNGDFHLSTHSLALTKMDIRAGNTLISDSIVFSFNKFYDFNYIWDSVYIDANLKNTVVDKKDLIKFFPSATRLPDKATISGKFSGLLSDFDFNNFNVTFGENTRLSGTMSINGLPSLKETFLSIDLINSTITLEDIESITKLKKGYYPELGVMRMDGQYLGYLNDFVAFGNFNTKYGTINSDINLKLSDDQDAKYSGQLALKNFNVGILTGIKDLGKVNFKGSVEGSGFSAKTTSMHVNGNIKSLEYKGYTYKNIYSDGDLANQFFEGVLNVDDENLKFDMTGKIDMSEDREYLNFTAHLDTINLKNLGLYEKNLAISTFGTVEINGLDPDYMEGTASFSNLFLKTDNNQLSLDTVHLIALKNEKIRTIEIKSELAEAKLTGEYKLSTIFNELSSLYKDYLNIFRNDTTKINSLAEVKKDTTSVPNVFDYQINFTDINSLFDVFVPDLKVSKNTSFIGNYQGGQTQIFNISTTSDTITYKNNTFLNNNLEINSSKALDNKVLAMIFIKSEEQNLAGIYSENLLSEAIWENDHIDFELNLDQESYKNHFNVLADIDFKNDSTLVTFQNSEIKLLDKLWELSEDGKIIFSGGDIYVDNFETKSPGQGFKLEGYLSSEEDKKFYIEFDSLQLENINSLINKELSGKLNGNVAISQFFGNTSIENELTITDLLINNFTVGDVEGSFLWNRMEKQFDVHFSVDYQKEITMELNGVYQPEKDENSLNIDAILVNAQLHILEPFIGSYFSKIAGTATGGFKITGTPLNPNIKGKGVLNDGEMTVNYLNTTYLLGGDFSFSEDMIFLDNINVKDKSGPGTGILSGKIEHGGFREMKVDILGNFNKINVLNTSMKDNSLFYGQGIGTGDITFSGYTSNLSIVTNVKTEKGTRIYIPIEGTEYAETSDFISFVSFSDTLSTKLSEIEKIDIKGVLLEMNIEITPDAYCEIIFDIKAGDIIRGRGNGDLSLRIDTNGEFTMFGPLTISEGWYNFTLYNLINKEFSILPGGVISWYGDPYGGIMDLKANYNQTASLTPILDPVYNSAPELSRKYPTQVVMDLKGPLLSPEITFDINAIDLPRNVTLSGGDAAGTSLDLDFEFNSFKNKIDEQELKRQVFSLIVLRRFSPPEAFNTGGAITNSVSELFSNQLSYWMSQVDSNLEVDFDVDLTKLDEEAFNTFQLRLSYAFLDGRLRITRDGAFTDNQKQVNINSLAGNWSVEYLLTSDGKIKAKMYNKNNFDNVNLPDRNTTNTTGFSLQYTKSFDEFLKEMGRIFKSEKDRDKPPVKNDNTKTEGIE